MIQSATSARGLGVGLCVLCLLSFGGCGDARRQALEGTVTYDGKPLDDGYITFRGQAGTPGPSAGGPIRKGHFSVVANQGTFAGTFQVEITALGKSNRKIWDDDSGKMVDMLVQYLPERYNSKTELTAEVRPGELNHFEFALTSR